MRLRSSERDYYVLEINTDPELSGTWQASFDDEETWVNGVFSVDRWSWLLAGPDFDADSVSMDDADTQATITETVIPLLRNADDPVLDVEAGPRITLVG